MLHIPKIDYRLTVESAFWMRTAISEVGTAEHLNGDNPRIIEYLKSVMRGALSDEIAWCAAFANWVLAENGLWGTGSPLARSFLTWDEIKCVELAAPRYGCVVVLRRGSQPWQGHVGFFIGDNHDGTLKLLGGNQDNQVCIRSYKFADVLGYRWPLYTVTGVVGKLRNKYSKNERVPV